MLHKVIFTPITAAQGNLHFYDLYVYFWTPLSSHIGISKISTPKTLLSQMDYFEHHPEHIIFFTFSSWCAHKGPLQDRGNRFLILVPRSEYKASKVGSSLNFLPQRQYYLSGEHLQHIFGNFYEVPNPSPQTLHNQILPK